MLFQVTLREAMIKSLGAVCLIAFLIFSHTLAGFSLGFPALFLSVLAITFGLVGVIFLTMPSEARDGGWALIRESLPMSVAHLESTLSDLSAQIRKDGLLSLEGKRKEINDSFLRYLLKKVMDGFEKAQTLPLIRNQAVRRAELIRANEIFMDRVASLIAVIGLVPALWTITRALSSQGGATSDALSVALIPFLMSIVLQLIAQAHYGKFFDELKEEVKLYYVVMEEGLSGIHDGQNPELLRDRMKARFVKAPVWKDV